MDGIAIVANILTGDLKSEKLEAGVPLNGLKPFV